MGSLAVGRESQGAISAAIIVVPDGQQHVPHVPANDIGALHALLDLDDMSVDRSFFMPLSLLELKASPAGCPAGCSGCPPGDSTPFTAPSPTPPDHHVRQRLEQLDDEPLVEPWTYVPQTPLSIDNRSPRDFAFHLPFRFLPNAKHDQNTNIGTFLDDSSYPHSGSSERHHLPDLGLDEFGPFHLDVDLPRSPVYRSFYLSPSASTTSLASEPCTYHHYFDNSSTSFSSIKHGAIMPDPTAVASADGAGPSGRPNFAAKPIAQRRQRRPHSAHSEQLARLPSPFFSLWAKRHHHQHMDHNGKPQQPFEYPGHGFTDTKPTTHKRFTHSRSSSSGTRQSQANAVPQMTREEFEALPLAIQRKYFSTLERLRFARESYLIDGITRHYDEISNVKRQKAHKQQSRSEQIVSRNGRGPLGGEPSLPSPVLEVPQSPLDNMRQQELTREEQVALARRLRASVILDAADEAIYKMNRRTSGHPSVNREGLMSSHSSQQTTTGPRDGVQSRAEQPISQELPQSFYDSFRWIDEEDDLDLRLFLDDYHKNLRDSLPSPKQTRPSFRRQMSVSKRPFGLSSMPTPTSRPESHNDLATGSPAPTSAGSVANSDGHTNRKARTLSLITPKHSSHESVFDPSATHYQDPEARLKLRVYLASPQKFDEAIEFGFPSTDALGAGPIIHTEFMETPLRPVRRKVQSTQKGEDTWAMGTFLADDDDEHVSLNSDQPSLADPESPKTPQAFESRPHPQRATSSDPTFLRDGCGMFAEGAGGYAQAPANSREMTLRMTLTRPDLRAHENEIYGWQQKPVYRNTRKSMSLGGFENKGMFYGEPILNESLENQASTTSEKGVMKRIWKRVRRT
ncbi:hypothetical protein N0V85_001772 [Neurospora sp. IMI 360204]|nr:hypothetical protein N0V85_001772 [Neurospora sp. IMI 360204]